MPAADSAGVLGAPVTSRQVAVAVGASIGGLLVHNLVEFPPSILIRPETWVPTAITVALGLGLIRLSGPSIFAATAGWAVIVAAVGGASVLPLSIWPFVPDQTVVHYAAHVVYALAQLPLLLVAWRGYRAERGAN